jgi:hypothetical protein
MEKITLFDGKEWEVDEILKKMDDDSFYYGYLGQNALSSSSAKDLYKSPKTYFNKTKEVNSEAAPLREGRLIHTVVLEEEKLNDKYDFVNIGSRRTKTFDAAYAEARNKGKEVMLTSELNKANELCNAIRFNSHANELFTSGTAETPAIGELFGLPFRGKADYLKDGHLIDLKTTSKLDGWERAAKYTWHYDMQGWIYCELFGVTKFTFVVIEKGTGDIGIFELSDETRELGGNKVKQCVNTYKEYFIDKRSKLNDYTIRGIL